MRSIRVLHCPKNVGGNPIGLARAERELGIDSRSVVFQRSPYGYEPDETLWRDGESVFASEYKRWRLLFRAMESFDIIHFNFGCSIMPFRVSGSDPVHLNYSRILWDTYRTYSDILELRDLPLLHDLGKGIIVTYQGDDARQGDFCQSHFNISPVSEVEAGYYSKESDEFKRRRITTFARYADRIYALNPDLLHVLPTNARFLPYSHVDLREWQPIDQDSHDVPVVVHAPSHRGAKGTRFILDAVSQLKAEGIPLKFMIVEGVTHTEVRKKLEQADIVIDQLLAGWYGGIAVEAMALGKSVICYIRENDLQFIPAAMSTELPIMRATPSTIYHVLKEWLTIRKEELLAVGRRGRSYVEHWHDPLKIANGLKRDYEDIVARGR